MAGPTLFAIIYSSVTIWTALLSRGLLGRRMSPEQWLAVSLSMLPIAQELSVLPVLVNTRIH